MTSSSPPPPPNLPEPAPRGMPVWLWVLLIGGALAMVGIVVLGGGLVWFGYQFVTHPEKSPEIAGWIRGDEQVRSRDDAKRTMQVWDPKRQREYQLKWEVPGRMFDWIEVGTKVASSISWRIEKPWEQRGSWQLTLAGSSRQAAFDLQERVKARGLSVTPDGMRTGGFAAIGQSPTREITVRANGNLLTIQASEFRDDAAWGQTAPDWVPLYPGAKITPAGRPWEATPMGESQKLLTAVEPKDRSNRGREWTAMTHRVQGATVLKLTVNESRW